MIKDPKMETPRTDDLESGHLKRIGIPEFYLLEIVEAYSLARELERENQVLRGQIEGKLNNSYPR
jgi:hypothetical protein